MIRWFTGQFRIAIAVWAAISIFLMFVSLASAQGCTFAGASKTKATNLPPRENNRLQSEIDEFFDRPGRSSWCAHARWQSMQGR